MSSDSSSFLASAGEKTGVAPVVTRCFGPRTAVAGFTGRTWLTTSQSPSMRIAARCCFNGRDRPGGGSADVGGHVERRDVAQPERLAPRTTQELPDGPTHRTPSSASWSRTAGRSWRTGRAPQTSPRRGRAAGSDRRWPRRRQRAPDREVLSNRRPFRSPGPHLLFTPDVGGPPSAETAKRGRAHDPSATECRARSEPAALVRVDARRSPDAANRPGSRAPPFAAGPVA